MFEKEIQTAKQQLSAHLLTGDTYVYLQDILNNPEIHSFYKGFFRGESDWWIYEQKMLREVNPRFDFGDKEFLIVQQEYDRHCRRTARFDHVELTSMIDLAAKTRVNFLLRPRTTLKWFVYRGEPTKPLHEVLLRFAYFDCYNYLLKEFGTWAAGKLAESSHQDILSVIEFERLIENIDNEIILEHTTSEFTELLSPLYEFFYEVQPEGHPHTIPTPALIIFLDDKGILRISQELERLMKEEDFDMITRQEFLNVIDNVILQVEEETGVPQTFVDDSTIPLDFDHSARRQPTPVQKNATISVPAPLDNAQTQLHVEETNTGQSEPEKSVEPQTDITPVASEEEEAESESAISTPVPSVVEEGAVNENISEAEPAGTSAEEVPEQPATILNDIPDVAEPVPAYEEASVAEEPALEADETSSVPEEAFHIVDIANDDEHPAVSGGEDEGEVLVLAETGDENTGETTAESTDTIETEEVVALPEDADDTRDQNLDVPSVEEQLEDVHNEPEAELLEEPLSIVDVPMEEEPANVVLDETTEPVSPDISELVEEPSSPNLDVLPSADEHLDEEQLEEVHNEPGAELLEEPLNIVEEAVEEEPADVVLDNRPEPVSPDISGLEEETAPDSDAHSASIVTDFPDENLDEYELYDTERTDAETPDSTVKEDVLASGHPFGEEVQEQNRSEEELYNALFPEAHSKNVQSDVPPSVDAGQHEPDVVNQEEVLLEQTADDTSGTSTIQGAQYSAIEELLDNNLRQRVVKHVFHRNEERFEAVLKRLNATRSWRDASSIIDRVFSEHEVDPYSSIARKFSDIVYERFLTGQ